MKSRKKITSGQTEASDTGTGTGGAVASVNGKTGAVTLTTEDINPVANKKYVLDSDLVKLANTSGSNTGDNSTNTTSNTYANSKATEAINTIKGGVPTAGDNLLKLYNSIQTINSIIGGTTPDGDNLINAVTEVLQLLENFPEGANLLQILAGKVNTNAIVNTLTESSTGKVLDASQGKALKDLIDGLELDKEDAFVVIAENESGTHPQFTTARALYLYILARLVVQQSDDKPDAPTNGIVDDTANTFTFTLNPLFSFANHQYSFDGGNNYTSMSLYMDNGDGTATISVENIAIPIGGLRVRVQALGENLSGFSLSNTVPFTVPGGSFQPIAPINPVVDDVANEFAFFQPDSTYKLIDHQYRYRPLGGSYSAWINCTTANTNNNSGGNYAIYGLPEIEIANGDVEVRVRAFGGSSPGVALASNAPFTVAPVPLFNIYVKSTGSDANDGLSELTPVYSLPRVRQIATSYPGAPGIKFLDKKHYRDSLILDHLDNVTIDGAGCVFDSSDVAPKNTNAWTQPDSTNLPNVWKISWVLDMNVAFEDFMREGVTITVDELMPTVRKTLVDLNANVGSFHMPDSFKLIGEGTPHPIIDIYVNMGSDPNTDNKVYEIMTRYQGLSLGANCTVTDVITKTQVSNDGSTKTGVKSLIKRCLFNHGHKHSVFIQSGAMEDCIAFDAEYDPTAAPFIAFMNNATGENIRWTRCMIIMPTNKIFNSSGFYGHPIIEEPVNDATQYNNWTIEQCLVEGASSIGGLYSVGIAVYRNNYGRCKGLDGTDMSTTIDRSIFNPFAHGAGSIRGVATVRNCVYYLEFGMYGSLFQMDREARSGLVLENCTITGTVVDRQTNDTYLSAPADYNFYYTIFLVKGINVDCPDDGSTYEGDYNIFFTNNGAFDNARFHWKGATINTLAAWQAASGQDANSVYVTTTQKSGFFLGDPSTGDFRIKPGAKVTAANGTILTGQFPDGKPLSLAGAQEHWNYNTRSVEAGPCLRWPVPPRTYQEADEYRANPQGWNFYP